MKPLISVVMPMHNAARYLAGAIDSIRPQTCRSWELLCLDDGSTDETRGIVLEHARHDARIRYIGLPHRGIVVTLNEGVRIAAGQYIARMDADDLAVPTRFDQQLQWLERYPDLAMVGTAYRSINSANVVWRTHAPPVDPDQVKQELAMRNCLCHPAMMMRAESLKQLAGPYRSAFVLAEDYDLWLRAVERFRIGNVPQVLLHYRRDFSCSNAARTIVQTISRMGCQFSARARARGEPDPAFQWTTVDRAVLLRHGFRGADINFEIRRALLREARQAKKHGFVRIADALMQETSQYAPRGESLRRRIDFHWRRLQIRVTAKAY